MSLHRIAIVAATAVASLGFGGCGSAADDACAPLRDTCLLNQQACVVSGGTAQCVACAAGQYAAHSGNCEPIGGTAVVHDFATFTSDPGQEILGLCQSWTLGNDTELWVNAVELSQNEASHHSNWMFTPDTSYPGPDGVWTCADRGYHQRDAAIAGGVLYAQSTQATHEVQKFPNGAAIRIMPHAKVIGDVHILNATMQSVSGHLTLGIYTVPVDQVAVKLAPFHLVFDDLYIAPHAYSRDSAGCDVYGDFEAAFGTPLQMQIYYVLPHTHAMAKRFFVDEMGGPNDGKTIIDVPAFDGEARGRAYDPPFDMAGADGFRFGCEWQNDRDVPVRWGFGDQEMCEALGFADSGLAFEAMIHTVSPAGTDGATQLFSGGCAIFSWKWNK
jgi:hypothetical protein